MAITNVYLIPVMLLFLLPGTFMVTYYLAVSFDHVSAILPYISDTGTYSPESCVFGQALNVIALLNFLFTWIRYAHVKNKCGADVSFAFLLSLNCVAYWLGVVTSIGMSIVANFQETNMLVLHGVGALLLFTPGLVYLWLQAYISIRIVNLLGNNRVAMFRLALAVIGTVFIVVGSVATPISFVNFHGDDIRKWKREDGGYVFHVVSTSCEWLTCLGFAIFVGTFIGEFKEIGFETPEVLSNNKKLGVGYSKCELLAGSEMPFKSTFEIQIMRDTTTEIEGQLDDSGSSVQETLVEQEDNRETADEEPDDRPVVVVVSTQPYRELYA